MNNNTENIHELLTEPSTHPFVVERNLTWLFLLAIFASASLFFALRVGSVHAASALTIWKLRLPRALSAFTVGGLLSLAGSLMQLLLQNPLADPAILGVSGGAAFFTLLMVHAGIVASVSLYISAWCGSLCAILCVLFVARQHRFQTHGLLLAGIALSSGFAALISLLLLMSNDSTLHSMLFWLSGDFNDTNIPYVAMFILIVGSACCFMLAPGFNILYRSEWHARALGIAWQRYRIAIYLLTSLFTATAVTLAGCVGFIGLLTPHFARKLVGFDHRVLLPACVLLGGSLLMIADTCARTWFAPQQIPVGIILAMIGVPVFIGLLKRT